MKAQAELDAYQLAHPEDLVGIDRILVKHGGKPMKVRVNGISEDMTAAQAADVLARREAQQDEGVGIMVVPLDAFTVSISVYGSFVPAGGRIVSGSWNFRDNYVNGSQPDDMAAITTELGGGCYRTAALQASAYDYQNNNYSGQIYNYSGGGNGSPIWGVRDTTTAFKLNTDHGTMTAHYDPVNAGCKYHVIGAEFYYEKTQDGSSGVSAGAGWNWFSVSYGSVGSLLRKSTAPVVWY